MKDALEKSSWITRGHRDWKKIAGVDFFAKVLINLKVPNQADLLYMVIYVIIARFPLSLPDTSHGYHILGIWHIFPCQGLPSEVIYPAFISVHA
jgi:hypothetical protein